MIVSFRDGWLRAFLVQDRQSRHIPPNLDRRLFRKLQMIDDATSDRDLQVPPSNHFERLRGSLVGFHSIRVNISGGWSSGGMAAVGKRRTYISTTTATDEASHADDEA